MNEELAREAEEAEKLAKLRWGPTGFQCPHCPHRHAYVLRRRPRVRECRRCGRQTSVTSGTLMHRTRLPLSAWAQYGQQLESRPQPLTITQLTQLLRIARSSAWLMSHKMMSASAPPLTEQGQYHPWRVRVRRPKRPLCSTAPDWLREIHERHRMGLIHPVEIHSALELVGPHARLEQVGLAPPQIARLWQRSVGRPKPSFDPHDLFRWLHERLRLVHRTVSLQWLPHWLGAHLAAWNRAPGQWAWARAVLAVGPRPLRLLDPWLGLFPRGL
jgi:transposase-like protein